MAFERAIIIPPITDPLGSSWNQPPLSAIQFRDGNAWMTLATFKELKEYSTTNPTGAYEGKMWRRHDGLGQHMQYMRGALREKPGPMLWLLCWFGASTIGPGYVSNNYAPIKLTDALIDKQ